MYALQISQRCKQLLDQIDFSFIVLIIGRAHLQRAECAVDLLIIFCMLAITSPIDKHISDQRLGCFRRILNLLIGDFIVRTDENDRTASQK